MILRSVKDETLEAYSEVGTVKILVGDEEIAAGSSVEVDLSAGQVVELKIEGETPNEMLPKKFVLLGVSNRLKDPDNRPLPNIFTVQIADRRYWAALELAERAEEEVDELEFVAAAFGIPVNTYYKEDISYAREVLEKGEFDEAMALLSRTIENSKRRTSEILTRKKVQLEEVLGISSGAQGTPGDAVALYYKGLNTSSDRMRANYWSAALQASVRSEGWEIPVTWMAACLIALATIISAMTILRPRGKQRSETFIEKPITDREKLRKELSAPAQMMEKLKEDRWG
jgi:hypothetical protein